MNGFGFGEFVVFVMEVDIDGSFFGCGGENF